MRPLAATRPFPARSAFTTTCPPETRRRLAKRPTACAPFPFTMRRGARTDLPALARRRAHHVQSRTALLALRVHAARKRDGQYKPHHSERRHERRPTVAQKRQGLSRDGQKADDATHVHAGLEGDHHRERPGDRASEHVGGVAAYAYARIGEQGEEQHYGYSTHQPEFLAYDGEDEIGVGIGQIEVLLLGQPEARAVRAAEGQGIQRLYGLVARVVRVAPRVD